MRTLQLRLVSEFLAQQSSHGTGWPRRNGGKEEQIVLAQEVHTMESPTDVGTSRLSMMESNRSGGRLAQDEGFWLLML